MNPISLMLVDDHPIFRHGLRQLVASEPDIQVVAEYDSCKRALEEIQLQHPQIVLLEISVLDCDAIRFVHDLNRRYPDVRLIILTARRDEVLMFNLLRAGAYAYYTKEVKPDTLLFVIREVAKGNSVVDDHVVAEEQKQAWLLTQFRDSLSDDEHFDDTDDHNPLSPREMDVLRLIVEGASNREIAGALYISPQTVKNHISSILRKLELADRTQVAVHAIRNGWIVLDEVEGS